MKTRFFKPLFSIVMLALLVGVTSTYPGDVSANVNHCGALGGNETWLASANVHIVTCDVTIPLGMTLTIEAGAIIKFQQYTQINVDGKLVAQGTSVNRIYFTSYYDDTIGGDTDGSPTAGAVNDWGHIRFNGGSDDTSSITRAVIRFSGDASSAISSIEGAIRLDNASPTLSYITFTDNRINGVEIPGGTWQSDTWDNTTLVYLLTGNVTIPAANTLTINPGMKIKLNSFRSINIDGKLVMPGTSANPVYLSSYKDDTLCGSGAAGENICDTRNDGSTAGAVNDWGHIRFNGGSDDTSSITRAVIRFSGDANSAIAGIEGAIRLDNASPTLSYITFTDNRINGVEIPGGTWQSDTWDNTTLIYLLTGNVTIPAANTLTINPGMKIKLASFRSINIDGKLVVPGTSTNPVYLSSYKDDTLCGIGAAGENICDTRNDGPTAGAVSDWGHIRFNGSSDDTSSITRAVIRFSGDANSAIAGIEGAIRLDNASPAISYTSLVNNYRGIEALNGSIPMLTCNDVYNNTNYGIYNNTPATIVTAENHWWGNAAGPTSGQVSAGVDYTPWATQSCLLSPPQSSRRIFLPLILR